MIDLKPCPFCGGEARMQTWATEPWEDHTVDACVYCRVCHASTMKYYPSEDAAAEAWNRRADNE